MFLRDGLYGTYHPWCGAFDAPTPYYSSMLTYNYTPKHKLTSDSVAMAMHGIRLAIRAHNIII